MSDSDAVMPNVFAPDDIVWHETDLGQNFWISDELVGTDYSTLFRAQLTKFGPRGGSPLHHHTYNHAFYFLSGTSRVQMGDRIWDTKPGTFVKGPGTPGTQRHQLRRGRSDLPRHLRPAARRDRLDVTAGSKGRHQMWTQPGNTSFRKPSAVRRAPARQIPALASCSA